MNKSELIIAMAEKAGMPRKEAETMLNAFIDSVTEALKNGDKVQLTGFGAFEVNIPASKAPVFKAGKALKDEII